MPWYPESGESGAGCVVFGFSFLFFKCNFFFFGNPVASQLSRMDLNPSAFHSLAVRSQQNSFLSPLQSLLRAVRLRNPVFRRKETERHRDSAQRQRGQEEAVFR